MDIIVDELFNFLKDNKGIISNIFYFLLGLLTLYFKDFIFRRNIEEHKSEIRVQEEEKKQQRQKCREAKEKMLITVRSLSAIGSICNGLRVMDIDKIENEIQENNILKEKIKIIFTSMPFDEIVKNYKDRMQEINVNNYELYIPEEIWNMYKAYQGIMIQAINQMSFLKEGLDSKYIKKGETIEKIVSIFPEEKKFLEKFPTLGVYFIHEDIYKKLIDKIKKQNFYKSMG